MAINVISSLGDDALANHFQVIFGKPFPGATDLTNTQFRITNVTVPDQVINTYEVHWKSQKATKPSGKDGTSNQFTFDLRVDKFYLIYKQFVDWHRLIIDPVSGAQSPDFANGVSPLRVPMSVLTIDSTDTVTSTGWAFDGCFPSTVPGHSFDMTSGDPLTVSITMDFITFNPLA